MARYSLFVLKVPLNSNRRSNEPSWTDMLTRCVRHLTRWRLCTLSLSRRSSRVTWHVSRDSQLTCWSAGVSVCVCRRSRWAVVWQRSCSCWQPTGRWRSRLWNSSRSTWSWSHSSLHEDDWLGWESSWHDDQTGLMWRSYQRHRRHHHHHIIFIIISSSSSIVVTITVVVIILSTKFNDLRSD